MPAKEEGVRPLSGKPSRCLRKPEQNSDRGTEIPERTLLPKRRPHLGLDCILTSSHQSVKLLTV